MDKRRTIWNVWSNRNKPTRTSHNQTAGKINKDIKATKAKVKVQIEGDKLRVSSASRDALQEVIAFLKSQDYGQPLQYTNYR